VVEGQRPDAAIAAIHADICATLAVPAVNLVWRHLATVPAALPWCWRCVRPLYGSGAAAAAAQALYAGLRYPPVPRLAAAELAAAGIDAGERARIEALLAGYERSNAVNLLALTALRQRLTHRPLQAGSAARDHAPQRAAAVPAPAVPAVALDALAPQLRAQVCELNRIGAAREPAFVATVWRQLAGWPALPGLLLRVLRPLEAHGAARRLTRAVAREADRLGAELLPGLGVAGEAPAAARIETALEPFIDDALPRTVALVQLVRTALGAER